MEQSLLRPMNSYLLLHYLFSFTMFAAANDMTNHLWDFHPASVCFCKVTPTPGLMVVSLFRRSSGNLKSQPEVRPVNGQFLLHKFLQGRGHQKEVPPKALLRLKTVQADLVSRMSNDNFCFIVPLSNGKRCRQSTSKRSSAGAPSALMEKMCYGLTSPLQISATKRRSETR